MYLFMHLVYKSYFNFKVCFEGKGAVCWTEEERVTRHSNSHRHRRRSNSDSHMETQRITYRQDRQGCFFCSMRVLRLITMAMRGGGG